MSFLNRALISLMEAPWGTPRTSYLDGDGFEEKHRECRNGKMQNAKVKPADRFGWVSAERMAKKDDADGRFANAYLVAIGTTGVRAARGESEQNAKCKMPKCDLQKRENATAENALLRAENGVGLKSGNRA